ncbi:MAG: ATP-dependent sacrificial sulfur transferase LarE [Fretibacterium sp.]|nr:ATP-dependent sacrificial sulfur transferase LarE [Fretibacterium sp.]
MAAINDKYQKLLEYLAGLGSAAVAFSGGVDSTFLLRAARDALGENVLAVTASSCFIPERETDEAKSFCEQNGIEQVECRFDVLAVEGVRRNPADRCYLCKRALFKKIGDIARERNLAAVTEGSNKDDEGDYRPGLRALGELGVKSPLRAVGFRKNEIRQLSRELGLPTWDKPSFACLASRFVYGETITEERLSRVDRAEQLLLSLGFRQMRVRIHGSLARVELLPEDFPRIMESGTRRKIHQELRELGFSYVTLDLAGYRTGSMNETLAR